MARLYQCLSALLLCGALRAAAAATVKLSFEMNAASNYFNDNAAKAFEARKLIRTIVAAPGSPATDLDVTGCSDYDAEGPHNACLVLVQMVQLATGPAHVTAYATTTDDANFRTALQNSDALVSTIDAAMTGAGISATATASTYQVGTDQGPVETETVTYTMDVAGADLAALTAKKADIAAAVGNLDAAFDDSKVLVKVSASSPHVVAIATVSMGAASSIVTSADISAVGAQMQAAIGGGAAVSNVEVGEDINLVIGAYGPISADAYQIWLSTFASLDVDFRSNYDAELAGRTGGPIIQVPNLHPRLRLKLQLATDHAQKEWAVQSALDYWYGQNGMQNIHGLIGGYHSAFSKPIAAIGNTLSNAQVSFGSTNAALSIKSDYGYFFRTIPEDSIQSAAMWNWVKFFEIPKFLSLYGDDGAYAACLSRGVQENAVQDEQLFRMQAIRVPDPLYVSDGCKIDAETGEPAALAASRTAKESCVKFMMICQTNPEWGCLAEQMRAQGLLGPNPGVQYLGSEALKSTASNPLPSGFMQFQPSNRDSGDIFTPNYVNLWSKMTADDVYGKLAQEGYKANRWYVPWEQMSTPYIFDKDEYDKTLEGPYIFDAGYTYIMAFNALLQSGKTLDTSDQKSSWPLCRPPTSRASRA